MAIVVPTLWSDWCEAVGVPEQRVDETTVRAFAQQTAPSKKLVAQLQRLSAPAPDRAPAWPRVLREDPDALGRALSSAGAVVADRAMPWVDRVQFVRLRFAAVLIAPTHDGGLGLDRTAVRRLTPRAFADNQPAIGTAASPSRCPRCATTLWLEILSANSSWSRPAVRQLVHDRAALSTHLHEPSSRSWTDWPDHPNLLPAIDRWGYLERFRSLHPSSLSRIIAAIALIAEAPPAAQIMPEPEPLRTPDRSFSADEVDDVWARADELNARISQLITEHR